MALVEILKQEKPYGEEDANNGDNGEQQRYGMSLIRAALKSSIIWRGKEDVFKVLLAQWIDKVGALC